MDAHAKYLHERGDRFFDIALEHRGAAHDAAHTASTAWADAERAAGDAAYLAARLPNATNRRAAAEAKGAALRARVELEKAEAVHSALAALVAEMLGGKPPEGRK